ncbi:MAG: EAL domain-containing protein [Pseudomonadota bacterium]
MKSPGVRSQQVISAMIALLGLYVTLGWLLLNETMVRVVPSSVAMGVNTAFLFMVSAICLWPSSSRKYLHIATAAAWLLILLPAAILFEHWQDINLGIDWTALQAMVKDGNPRPGRTPPNTCLGFLSAGIAFFGFVRAQNSKPFQWAIVFFVYVTLAIGITSLIGYALKLEQMYRWAEYNRMAIPTAVGISLIGISLFLSLQRASWRKGVVVESSERRITRTAALVLTVVAFIAGLTGFVVLKQSFEETLSNAFLRTTKNTTTTFASTIEQKLVLATTIASRPGLKNHLLKLNDNPNDPELLRQISEIGGSFMSSGLTGIHFFNAKDESVGLVGTMIRQRAVMAIPLHKSEQNSLLLWQNGFVLWTEKTVTRDGHVVGKFIAEQHLPELTAMLRDPEHESESTDALLCGRDKDEALCFPSRFYEANRRIPMYKDGKPYLAISRALLNQRGVISVKDLRGIPVLAGYAPVGELGLGLVLKTDSVELYATIRDRLNLLTALLLGLIAIGTLLLRAQVQPLARQLVKDKKRIAVILDSSHEAFIEINQDGIITDWNGEAERTFGWSRQEAVGRLLAEVIIPPVLREAHIHGMAKYLQTGEGPVLGKRIELPAIHRDGKEFLVERTISAISNENGYSFTAFLHDISERKQAEAALNDEKERLRVTLSSIGDAVITTDTAGNVTYLNPVAETMTGWRAEEVVGLPLTAVFSIVNENTGEIAPNPVDFVLQHEKNTSLADSTTLIQRGGNRFPIEDSAAPIRDSEGAVIGVVLVFHDVSQSRKMAAEMTHQASHDALTGLINRREFERRLEYAVQTGQQQGKQHTLLYLDLDQFKVVNDTCGHMAGDELLRQVTAILQRTLRKSDTFARLGGDEFGVLLESCPTEPGRRIAEGLRQLISDFRFVWLDKTFRIGVSIGLVTFSNGGVTLSDVLRMADAACYVAKDKGRNRVHVYTAEDKELSHRSGEMGWIGDIQKALDEQRFVLYSQKILALNGDFSYGEHYELLLRMRSENGDLIPPMAFIPAAERYSLMPLLDRWVIKTAFAQHARRQVLGKQVAMCAINLSGKTICDENFLPFIQEQFAHFNVAPETICFEVTETAAIANLNQAVLLIRELKAIGCRFALDDFGSGMSSFGYLKHLPVDYLKIDGEFVKNMMNNPVDHAMVKSIHNIGHVMGIQTIAEFVENDAILNALREIGVDFAQGNGVEEPRPAS